MEDVPVSCTAHGQLYLRDVCRYLSPLFWRVYCFMEDHLTRVAMQ
jgi:hypothetical protein